MGVDRMGVQGPDAPTAVVLSVGHAVQTAGKAVRNLLPPVPRVVHPPEIEAQIAAAVDAGVAAAPRLSGAQQDLIRRVFAGSITRPPLRRSA